MVHSYSLYLSPPGPLLGWYGRRRLGHAWDVQWLHDGVVELVAVDHLLVHNDCVCVGVCVCVCVCVCAHVCVRVGV